MNEKIVYLFLLLLSFTSLFLPFSEKEIKAGKYIGLFEHSSVIHASINKLSGFEFPIVFISFLFLIVIPVLIFFTEKKIYKVIAFISLGVYLFFNLGLYYILTFDLTVFGPPVVVKVGIGYYLFCSVTLIFSLYTVYNLLKNWNDLNSLSELEEGQLNEFESGN
jgi:hypothetical protein